MSIARGMMELKARIKDFQTTDWGNQKAKDNTEQSILIEWRRLDKRVRDAAKKGKVKSRLPRNYEESVSFADSFFGD